MEKLNGSAGGYHFEGYSLAERDWRWQRVRDSAARLASIVSLCRFAWTAETCTFRSSSRVVPDRTAALTQLENAAVVLPTDGRKPIVISDQETGNEWVPEFRPVDGSWGKAMAQALIDAGMKRRASVCPE